MYFNIFDMMCNETFKRKSSWTFEQNLCSRWYQGMLINFLSCDNGIEVKWEKIRRYLNKYLGVKCLEVCKIITTLWWKEGELGSFILLIAALMVDNSLHLFAVSIFYLNAICFLHNHPLPLSVSICKPLSMATTCFQKFLQNDKYICVCFYIHRWSQLTRVRFRIF